VSQLRSPIIWRLFLLFLFLSLIPIGIIFVYIQGQVRDNEVNTQLNIMRDHARIYSARIIIEPGKEQEFAVDMSQTTDGDTFFLLATNGQYIAHSNPNKVGGKATDDFSFDILQKLLARESTVLIDEKNGLLIGSYRDSLTSPLAVSVSRIDIKTANLNRLTNSAILQLIAAILIVSIGAGVAVLGLLNPLIKLADYANVVGQGNLEATLDSRRMSGEIRTLADNIQGMAKNLKASITSLELRVSDRTQDLEHRARLLKAVADVGKAISSVRNLSELLQQTAFLINENFGYYHVGIFLLDERKEYAILTATNSEGGRRMLERHHQLKVGETGIVGYATQQIKARIALDVGQDAVFFNNPDLPNTRSEMALPLVASGQVLGALDVQSTESQAFSEEDIATLQILADQLAIAIQNANLFNETEKALEAARQVYGDVSREAWRKILRSQPRVGYLATPATTAPTRADTAEASIAKAYETGDIIMGEDGLTISIPIKVRGQPIGAIRLKKSDIAEAWTQEEINLAIALSDQLSGALESARLYRESQQRAARESLVSDISARISSTSHTDAILRETVHELGQALGNASVTIQLLEKSNGQNQSEVQERGGSSFRKNGKTTG
jgi:GAF domain-containing protein/HAMP domain-containing protein